MRLIAPHRHFCPLCLHEVHDAIITDPCPHCRSACEFVDLREWRRRMREENEAYLSSRSATLRVAR